MNRYFWAPIGVLGLVILTWAFTWALYHRSIFVLIGLREYNSVLESSVLSVSVLGWVLLFFRHRYYHRIDLVIILVAGMAIGFVVSPQGYYMHDDYLQVVAVRAFIFCSALLMLRAWFIAGRP